MLTAWNDDQRLRDIATHVPRFFYRGRVIKVIGLVIEASLPHVPIGALCLITLNHTHAKVEAEVIGLRGDIAVLMPISGSQGIGIGDEVQMMRSSVTVGVSEKLLGRIVNGAGEIMDQGPSVIFEREYPIYANPIPAMNRKLISDPLSLGIRAIDGFLTCALGQRMAIMAGSGVGKSTLLGMMARNAKVDVNVIGLIGERGREVREFIERDLGPEGLSRSVIVIATSDAPALLRMRAAFVATTIAEYFRDQGKRVLLMMDSLTRYAMATREVGLSLGEPPTVKGYTPSLFSNLPRLLERAGTTETDSSITGLYTILTEGDDIQDPIADAVRAIVDGHIVLSRKLNAMGHYPPIDVLQSLSRVMSHVIQVGHAESYKKMRRYMALYQEMEDFIKMGVYTPGKNTELDCAIEKNEEIQKFLRQNIDEKTTLTESVEWLRQLSL